jgi:hypothetical protein
MLCACSSRKKLAIKFLNMSMRRGKFLENDLVFEPSPLGAKHKKRKLLA